MKKLYPPFPMLVLNINHIQYYQYFDRLMHRKWYKVVVDRRE